MEAASHLYAIGLGSNRRHGRHGSPRATVMAALAALEAHGVTVHARSPVITTAPLGPGGRAYANAAAILSAPLAPPAFLALLKTIERDFGRRRGRRWGARVIDLDILLWSGGHWRSALLMVPHRSLAQRRFVLDPLAMIAGRWRLPGSALAIAHLAHRIRRTGVSSGRSLRYPPRP